MAISITRLSGGNTPADGSDPRTFPAIWNATSDALEADVIPTDVTSPATGQLLQYNGTNWVNVGQADAGAIPVFADAAARTTAIPSPSEGMVTYLSDSDAVQVYDGSSYKQVGGLVAVKSALKDDTFSASVAAGGNVAVTDLSITHEVSDSANKLIITAFFGAAASTGNRAQVGLAVHDGTGLIAMPSSTGSRTGVTAGGLTGTSTDDLQTSTISVSYVYTPGAGSKTYTARAINIGGSTQTLYINRTEPDTDVAFVPRAVSSLMIQEVSV